MLCGVCFEGVDEPAPAARNFDRRGSLPGGGTGFLEWDDAAHKTAVRDRAEAHGLREIDAALDRHRSEARALAMAIIERAQQVSRGPIDGKSGKRESSFKWLIIEAIAPHTLSTRGEMNDDNRDSFP